MRHNKSKLEKKFKLTSRASLVVETSKLRVKTPANKKTLKRALKHLLKKNKKEERCKAKGSTETRVDDQVKLKCRQLPNVVEELRKSIMRQDWNECSTLLMILCHPGIKLYSTVIIKTCFILLFSHPRSSLELLKRFVRNLTGYILEEDVNKFIKIIFALRKTALSSLTSGKYVRKRGDYKISNDPDFDSL